MILYHNYDLFIKLIFILKKSQYNVIRNNLLINNI